MKVSSRQKKSAGFAAVEAVLMGVIIAGIVGVGAYTLHQKHTANSTLSSTSSTPTQSIAPNGSTTSIDKLTQQDAQTEAGVDKSADSQTQQNASSANASVNNVGGAYDESSL